MAYVPLLYSLGWPGMESLPCVVVDHVTREVYSNDNKLPLNKLYLNTTANKYVELSAVLKLFPPEKDKDAMHTFMTISSEFGMRKFFMDRCQRAYISLDTLLVYMIVYPYCPEFLQARSEVARFLQSYRELPCFRCGFIRRDCRCTSNFLNVEEEGTHDIIGYATGLVSQETQTEGIDFDHIVKDKTKEIAKIIETKSCSTQTWIAPPSQKGNFGTGSAVEREKPSVKITPINVVTPMKTKVVMVDASCQTRANFDFNIKSRIKTMPSSVLKESENSGTGVITINNETRGSAYSEVKENTPGYVTALPSNQSSSLLPKQPLKISLWKLLDSDSSDDEFVCSDDRKNKAKKEPVAITLPKSLDFSSEPKESNTTENLTKVERDLLLEAEKLDVCGSNESNFKHNKGKDPEGLICPEYEHNNKSEQGEVEGKNRLHVNLTSDKMKEEIHTNSDHVNRQVPETVKPQVNDETQDHSIQHLQNSPEEAKQLMHKEKKQMVLIHQGTQNLNRTEEGLPEEDMDISLEMTSFEPLSENVQAATHSENSVNDVRSVNRETVAMNLSSQDPEPTQKSGNCEDIVRCETHEGDLVVDKTAEKDREDRDLIDVNLKNAERQQESSGVIGRITGEVSARTDSSDKLSLPSTSEHQPVCEIDSQGEVKPESMKTMASDELETDQVKLNVEDLPGEKPEMSYKKWCHKFEYTPTSEKLYRCTFLRCGQCFDTKKAAVVHNKVHGPFGHENPTHLVCFKCDYTTGLNKWFDLVRHLKLTHSELITNHEFGCYLCGRDFENIEKLNRHIDFHYSGRYKCVHCGAVLFTWKQVEEHVKETCESKDKKEKNLGCPYCPLVFHIRNMRNAHMLSHQDKGLMCAFCDSQDLWENWKQLRKHYQQKHPHKIRCTLNPHKKRDAYDTKQSRPALQSFKIDIKKNPVCYICEEEFEGDEDFFYHMSKKHDFVPYVLSVCEICEKTFRTQKMYDWHMRNTHSEDIKCERCSFVAKTQAVLRSHMQTRHQDREHTCIECGKDFVRYRELRMHMARHALHTIYCCEICGEEFKRQRELRQHSATVHPKQNESLQQECLECDYRCYTRRAMEAHVRKYHPKLAEEIDECESEPPPQLGKPETPPLHEYSTAACVKQAADPPNQEEIGVTEDAPRDPVGARPSRSGKKKSRKKLKKIHTSEPRLLTDKEEERRQLKRQRREKIDKLRLLIKVSSARTRTYEDFRDMLALNLIEHPQEQTIDHEKTPIIHSEHDITEPAQKRQKVSKYGRSIVTKALDDIYVSGTTDSAIEKYVEQPQHLHEKQRRAEAQKKRRAANGLYGLPQPASWAEELLEYPYSDHSYFALENSTVVASNEPSSLPFHKVEGPVYEKQANVEIDSPTVPLSDIQTCSNGASGVAKKQHSRKQTIKYRASTDTSPVCTSSSLDRSGEFVPLHSVVSCADYSQADVEYGKDIQEEIINQELMREVNEIAQQDPVLQDLINSMQQNSGNMILSANQMAGDVYASHSDSLLVPAEGQVTTPPKTSNLPTSMQMFDSTTSPSIGELPTNTPVKSEVNIGTGLTPSKQNVVDFLLGKLGSSELEDIDVNDEELKLLLSEHVKAEQVQSDGSQKVLDRSEVPVSVVQKQIKGDVLSTRPYVPLSVTEVNEIEEFVTADGRILRTSGRPALNIDSHKGTEMVNFDNPDITSITPVVGAQEVTSEHSEALLSKDSLMKKISEEDPFQVPAKKDVEIPDSSQPVTGQHNPSQSSGIDALLEASELFNLTQLDSKITNQDIDLENVISNTHVVSEEQIQFLSPGQLMKKSNSYDSIRHTLPVQTDMTEHDSSDTDSSPDKDLGGTFRESPPESEYENLIKGPKLNVSTRSDVDDPALLKVSREASPIPQPQPSSALISSSGNHQVVVRHMLQEPATVSVLPPSSQRVLARPSPPVSTVKLVKGPPQRPTVISYSREPISSYNPVIRQVHIPHIKHHVVNQFQSGRPSMVSGAHPRPAHRIVRLRSPTPQSQVISVPHVRTGHTSAAHVVSTTQKQEEFTRSGTKIIRIIQKPVSKENSMRKVDSTGPGMSSQ